MTFSRFGLTFLCWPDFLLDWPGFFGIGLTFSDWPDFFAALQEKESGQS